MLYKFLLHGRYSIYNRDCCEQPFQLSAVAPIRPAEQVLASGSHGMIDQQRTPSFDSFDINVFDPDTPYSGFSSQEINDESEPPFGELPPRHGFGAGL